MIKYFKAVLVLFVACSCSSWQANVRKNLKKSEVFKNNFVGFSLYDLDQKKTVFGKNANKYFQPASNTKLFTFYAGLKVLGDSVPALKYIKKDDSLIFWGTGDPSLLHPDLPKSNVLNFLKGRPEKLFFSNANVIQPIYGAGWAWDDYNDDYQTEISSLPLFGNFVRYSNVGGKLFSSPFGLFANTITRSNNYIIRDISQNLVSLPTSALPNNFKQDVPFKTNIETLVKVLSDTLKRQIGKSDLPIPKNSNTLFSIKADSLYKRMLHVSDNMIAEQIMLIVSKSDTMNTAKSIDFITKNYLNDLPDKPKWVDGSGLSRYNLFTPRTIVKLLEKIHDEIPEARLYNILPTGGQTGNLKNMFKGLAPFIYAKSGSFSNNYNLSGYIVGMSGKTYAFSFMNNNFIVSMAEIRKEVERILTDLREKI
jgi:serine-type D-Ala-D-Ala carboxypeptidase/endopeptidase (penicillin-binding protein 4)